MLGQPAADHAAGRQPERLGGVVDADGGAARRHRRDARHQRRQAGFQDIESNEEQRQQHSQPRQAVHPQRKSALHQQHQEYGTDEQFTDLAAPLGRHDGRHHEDKGNQHRRQVDLPVRFHVQPGVVDQRHRHHHEHGHLHHVQHENAEVEAQQFDVAQHAAERRALDATFVAAAMFAHRLRRHGIDGHGDGQNRQHADHVEYAVHADGAIQRRRRHQRHGEGEADGRADHGHDLGAMLLAREIGGHGDDCRRDGAGALDGAADDDAPDVGGHRGHETADGEQHQAEHDDAFASEPVGGHAEGDLQDALTQAVDAHGQPHQRLVVAARHVRGMHGKHRQDQEQPQHAQGEQRRQRRAGTQFQGRHTVG